MPRAATADEEAKQEIGIGVGAPGGGGYDQLDEALLAPAEQMPIIVGALVVYMGGHRNKTVAFPGRVTVETLHQPTGEHDAKGQPVTRKLERRDVVIYGHQAYDFSTHDTFGELIVSRLMPDSEDAEVRGRPFTTCEHPEHLRLFFRSVGPDNRTKDFRVRVPRDQKESLSAYIREKERRLNVRTAAFNAVVTSAA